LIHISTNAVFGGTSAPYKEDDQIDPVNYYGRVKAECESLVRAKAKCCIIVRPILMYGWNYSFARSNPVTWAFEKLRKNETIRVVNDIFENPLNNVQCGEALWKIVEQRPAGIIHLAGGERINRFDFLNKVADVFSFDRDLLQPVSSSFFKTIARRPADTTLATQRMKDELGFEPLPVVDGLVRMKEGFDLSKQYHFRDAPTSVSS
jgi:dTDP-4-dehydrorhamnose reductase